ncbi:MAG: HAMP domain-containing sensor histidine kinase [Granulosicoccaceae bacterium]
MCRVTKLPYCFNRRIGSISQSIDNVAAGNLDARLPIGSSGDDIDQLSIKMNDALDRLKGTVDGMKQVSSDIAHDLKTPLNRLYINLEEAARRQDESGSPDESLERALDEAENINSTFEALLRIAQIEAGARRAQFKTLDICALIHSVADVYSPVVQEAGQTLTIDDCSVTGAVTMMGDRDLLMQMLVNLIENSLGHCGDGTRIVLAATQVGANILISVGDNGPGIPEAGREKIFRRLYRVEASRTTPGTGLGLSMVKAISDLHCGNIDVCDNEPGCDLNYALSKWVSACSLLLSCNLVNVHTVADGWFAIRHCVKIRRAKYIAPLPRGF